MTNSMQCPKCHQAVAISDNSGGQRVRCPHCKHEFLVPGVVASANDDDDWLNLDDPVPSSGSDESPAEDSADQWEQSEDLFSEQLPDLNSSFPNSPPAAADRSKPSMPAASSAARNTRTNRAPVQPTATPADVESEYRIRCKVCGSMLDVKAERAGETIKCPDCYTQLVIPPPPKKQQKKQIDLDSAETFTFSERKTSSRPEDPFRKSATELLDAASREEDEDEAKNRYDYDTPKIREWASTVFGVFKQPPVLFHWLVLSSIASLLAAAVLSSGFTILILGLFPGGIVFAGVVVGCGFAILQSLANGEDSVTDWPVFADPVEWLATLGVGLAAAVLSALPALALSNLIFSEQPLVVVFLTMVSIYALYPFVLLSMLDMQSILTPFSPEVAKSVTRCEESWGGYYFSSGLLFFVLFLIFVVASLMSPPVAAVVAIFSAVGAAFLYFAMLGRLAFQIGQSINAEPRDNDIEKVRESEQKSHAS